MDSAIVKLPASLAAHGERTLGIDDHTLGDIGLEKYCPLDDGHFTATTIAEPGRLRKRQKREKSSTTGDSTLERLPLEILFMIFLPLDIPTSVIFHKEEGTFAHNCMYASFVHMLEPLFPGSLLL